MRFKDRIDGQAIMTPQINATAVFTERVAAQAIMTPQINAQVAFLSPAGATGLGAPLFYVTKAVHFDGLLTDMVHATAGAGMADSPTITFGGWFKADRDNQLEVLWQHSNNAVLLTKRSDNTFQVSVNVWNGTMTLLLVSHISSLTLTVADGWTWVGFCINAANTAQSFLCKNDTVEAISFTNSAFPIPLNTLINGTNAEAFGRRATAGVQRFRGDMADCWFDQALVVLGTESERRKFIRSDGKPNFLGLTGKLPGGVQPYVFLKGDAPNFGGNLGTVGAFSVSNLTDATTSPTD